MEAREGTGFQLFRSKRLPPSRAPGVSDRIHGEQTGQPQEPAYC